MVEKKLTGRIGTVLTALLVGINTLSMVVSAKETEFAENPADTQVQADSQRAVKVSGLSITDIKKPCVGEVLQEEATVMTKEGPFWSIPVIWLDDLGCVATKCEAGRNYYPTFAFFLPEGVKIEDDKELSVSFPESVSFQGDESGLITVADPSGGITYLTTAAVARAAGDNSYEMLSVSSAGQKAAPYNDIYISHRDLEWADLIGGEGGVIEVQTLLDELGWQISNDAISSMQGSQGRYSQDSGSGSWQSVLNWQYQDTETPSWLSAIGGQYQTDVVKNVFDPQNYEYQNYALQTWLNGQGSLYQDMSAGFWQYADASGSYGSALQSLQYLDSGAVTSADEQLWQAANPFVSSIPGAQGSFDFDQAAVNEWLSSQHQVPYWNQDFDAYFDQGYNYTDPCFSRAGEGNGTASGSNMQSDASGLVSVHCTEGAISVIGRDNLQNLVHVIRDVIEPQAVYQLTTKFDSFSKAAGDGELGEQIGLYIYNSGVDSQADFKNGQSYAYVLANVTGEKMEYFIGVDTNNFYHEADGKYVLNDDAFDVLSNTITHELMHAFMYDYTRSGMVGRPDKDNMFPSWFIEGMATTVDEAYNYQSDIYVLMQLGDRFSYSERDYLTGYTDQSVLSFFNGGVDSSLYGDPRLSNRGETQSASSYVAGYLACVYLGSMAASNAGLTVSSTSNGQTTYDSEAIRGGLDIVLTQLHKGTSLDDIIREVSNNAYGGVSDFEDKFLKGSSSGSTFVSQDKGSLDFCVDYLNYLNDVSKNLSYGSSDLVLATGSLLMPLDSPERSPITEQNPVDMPQQQVFSIVDSNDWVVSTVDPKVAFASAGTYSTGDDTAADDRMAMAAKALESGVLNEIPETMISKEELFGTATVENKELVSELKLEDLIGNMPQEYQEYSVQDLIDAYSSYAQTTQE